MDKIVAFDNGVDNLLSIANRYIEKGEHEKALGFLLSAYRKDKNPETVELIARTYGELEMYEEANKFWFILLSKTGKTDAVICYQELVNNYYMLDNMWAFGYYLNKLMKTTGTIDLEGLSDEVNDFLSTKMDGKNLYRIAYPFDRADYSMMLSEGKSAFNQSNYYASEKIYSAVPKECRDEIASGELAISYLMNNKDDMALETCKNSLEIDGENITAYCNLSTIYKEKKDLEKSKYYYNLALSLLKGEEGEEYKLINTAIDQNDFYNVNKCLDKIMLDKTDAIMYYFKGVATCNLGNTEGREYFLAAYRLCPFDPVYKYYAENAEKCFPTTFDKRLPKNVEKQYKAEILAFDGENAGKIVKKEENLDKLIWGLYSEDSDAFKASVNILALSLSPRAFNVLNEYLLTDATQSERKRLIIYALIVSGRRTVCVSENSCFVKIKLKDNLFDNTLKGLTFTASTALCISKIPFLDMVDFDKICRVASVMYKKYADILLVGGYKTEEIAAEILYKCNFEHLNKLKGICSLYAVKEERIKEIDSIVGVKDD